MKCLTILNPYPAFILDLPWRQPPPASDPPENALDQVQQPHQ